MPRARSVVVVNATFIVAIFAACMPLSPPNVTVHVDEDAPFGLLLAAEDVRAFSEKMGRTATLTHESASQRCEVGEIHVVVRGPDDTLVTAEEATDPQMIVVAESRCGAHGALIETAGGSDLSSQWAVYELLERWGVRFFHPEETYAPPRLTPPDDALDVRELPFIRLRSMNVHRTHPVELSAPLAPSDDVDMALHQRRWIDWCVRNKHTACGGWDRALVETYAFDRGFPRNAGLNLLNTQQGGRPVIDPDDPRSEEEQIEEAIVASLVENEGEPSVTSFGFQFNPSEFTEADPTDTVRRLTFIADWFLLNRPEIDVTTINHGTHGALVEPYGKRFFDLSSEAPTNLGVRVHTLMFYDLVRDAPVYGNTDFRFLYRFIRDEAPRRRITHYPESSWWLTFDLPVPLYLAPVTIDARALDLDAIGDLASPDEDSATGLYGHHLFTSGQEWGYWLIDWCFSRQSFRRQTGGAAQCLREFTEIFDGGEIVLGVLLDVAKRQNVEMRDPEILRFLVGSDDETEIAFETGIDFHPLPPAPKDVLTYSDAQVETMRASLASLTTMAAAYANDAAIIARVSSRNPDHPRQRLLREVRDGLAITGLRAAHAVAVYETALALRAAIENGSLREIDEAFDGVAKSRALTDDAREIVRGRERDHRYPAALTIDGDEPGTPGAVENKTIYPYRYLSRTHRMFYWTRPDDQLAALFGEGLELVRPSRRIVVEGNPLVVTVLADEITAMSTDWGDGVVDGNGEHLYASQGNFSWALDATTTSGAIHHEDQCVVVDRRFVFKKGRLKVVSPPGAAVIDGLLPGAVVGLATFGGADQFVFGAVETPVDDISLVVAERGKIVTRARDALASGPEDLSLSLRDIGDVQVYGATLRVRADAAVPNGYFLDVEGEMHTGEIIDLLVGVGGFEEQGAKEIVASFLEYTPDTLPDVIPFSLLADGLEQP